jgi:glycosyltransferase involved in cell wall biosynthesis
MNKSNRKIGVVIGYYNRQYQLNKTLETLNHQKYDDLHVVIVDDNSNENIILPKCDFDIKIIKIGNEKQWTNPEPAYNRGFIYLLENTDSEIIMIQNAECYHVGNVLEYASIKINNSNYITFGCYSINYDNTFNFQLNIFDIIKKEINITGDCTNGWYNHPIYRPKAYEFCSAIHRDNLIKLNGYDERLSLGIGFGDNYILHRIKLLNLNIEITENPFVVHQWHNHSHYDYNNINIKNLFNKNENIYNQLIIENKIRAVHIFTKDLC